MMGMTLKIQALLSWESQPRFAVFRKRATRP